MNQANNVSDMLYCNLSNDVLYSTLDNFWRYGNELFWIRKDIKYGYSQFCHKKYSFKFTGVLSFIEYRVTYKIIGIGSAERSWRDVKNTKPGKRSTIGSGIYDNQCIIYTSSCI